MVVSSVDKLIVRYGQPSAISGWLPPLLCHIFLSIVACYYLFVIYLFHVFIILINNSRELTYLLHASLYVTCQFGLSQIPVHKTTHREWTLQISTFFLLLVQSSRSNFRLQIYLMSSVWVNEFPYCIPVHYFH